MLHFLLAYYFWSSFMAIINNTANHIDVLSSCECIFQFLEYIFVSGIAASHGKPFKVYHTPFKVTHHMCNLLRIGFPIWFHHFTFLPEKNESFPFALSVSTLATNYHFFSVILVGVKWYIIVVLVCSCRKSNIVVNLFMWLLTVSIWCINILRIFYFRGSLHHFIDCLIEAILSTLYLNSHIIIFGGMGKSVKVNLQGFTWRSFYDMNFMHNNSLQNMLAYSVYSALVQLRPK